MSTARSFRQRVFRSHADDTLPLAIEHQRIYILPTGRGCAFVAVLLLMLVASVNYALSLGYALCFLLTGLFASALLQTYRNMAGLQVTSITATAGFVGEALPFTVHLDGTDDRLRQSIRIETRSGETSSVVDRARKDDTGTAVLAVTSEKRGRLPLGRLTLSTDWPLGLWRGWSYLHTPVSATVWPAPESDAPPLPVKDSDGGAGQRAPSIDGDISGLRDWVPGDAPSRIVWKRVARGSDPQVRLQDAAASPANAELALSNTRLGALEAQLSRLCAWVLQAEQQGADYALTLPGVVLETSRGQQQRAAALDALALHGLEPR